MGCLNVVVGISPRHMAAKGKAYAVRFEEGGDFDMVGEVMGGNCEGNVVGAGRLMPRPLRRSVWVVTPKGQEDGCQRDSIRRSI